MCTDAQDAKHTLAMGNDTATSEAARGVGVTAMRGDASVEGGGASSDKPDDQNEDKKLPLYDRTFTAS